MSNGKDGILVVDKPAGMSSYRVVDRVKHFLGCTKVGHTGTLDPFATGVLPICVNQATKAAQFFLEDMKEYHATMQLGVETDTFDRTGKVTITSEKIPTDHEHIRCIGAMFTGRIRQHPPAYSAVKINGVPSYRAARKGIAVLLPQKEVFIEELEVLQIRNSSVTFRVRCSKGTYIRSLACDWGRKLGCGAHLTELRRVMSGPFTLDQAFQWTKEIDQAPVGIWEYVIPLNKALSRFPELVVDGSTVDKVKNGQRIQTPFLNELSNLVQGDKVRLINEDQELIAVAETVVKDSSHSSMELRPIRVFNSSRKHISFRGSQDRQVIVSNN